MDYGGRGAYPGSNAIEIIPDTSSPVGGGGDWTPGPPNDQAIWATEDDYRSQSGGSEKQYKKLRGDSHGNSSSKSKAIGKMFFKTKLCCKFRAGTCPYITNCNFAHGMEELRRPPPNWQEVVASHDEGSELQEEHQIPIVTSSSLLGDGQRSYKGRHCKKFYTDEGCPYGENCTFMHDEQYKARESVVISLSPTVGGGGYGGGVGVPQLKPSNWKTKICNKWEMTGYCPFGSKCHFAHGMTELHSYGGELVELESRGASLAVPDSTQGGASTMTAMDTVVASNTSGSHADVYYMGVHAQKSAGVGQRLLQKWKGPDKISRIYGDWIDDSD